MGVFMKATQISRNNMVRSFDRAIANNTLVTSSPRVGLLKFASREFANCLTTKRALSCFGPSCGPDFAGHLIHWKTCHQVDFTIHTFYHFIKGKFFQRVFLKVEAPYDVLQQASSHPFHPRFSTRVAVQQVEEAVVPLP